MERNPYIGPRPFERGDSYKLYGRERETRDLLALIGAEREVLVYGRSGAGKTSLINAGLIPELEALRYDVLPVLRVGADLPPGIDASQVDNIFIYNALLGLYSALAATPGRSGSSPVDTRALLAERLPAVLQSRFSRTVGELRPLVLIFDQVEELFSTHSDRWQDVRSFFDQVRSALEQVPRLAVIFCINEEYLAALDPYLGHFRARLRARYRLDLLRPESALEAVTQPALQAGVPFTPEAAGCLVENLRRVVPHSSQQTDPRSAALAPLVDPLYLQVTCRQLWRGLPDDAPDGVRQISARDVPTSLGDNALNDYYELGLREASHAASITDREVRRWVTRQLVAMDNSRRQVQQGVQTAAGLPNDAVQALVRLNLIRAETRAGARWLELAHDRLVAIVQSSNRNWERSRLTPLRATARRWKETGEPSLLYRGRTLTDLGELVSAAQERRSNLYDLEPVEIEFYQASRQAEQRAARRVRWMWGGLALAAMVMLVLIYQAIQGRNTAYLAEQGETIALDSERVAQLQLATALDQRATAVAAIVGERQRAERARADQYAARSGTALKQEQPQLSLLLGAQSIRLAEANGAARSIAGEQALRDALSQVSGTPLQGHTQSITGLAASPITAQDPNGHWLATAGDDGQVFLWDLSAAGSGAAPRFENPRLLSGHKSWVSAAVFSPDGHYLATAGRDGIIRVWDMTAPDAAQAPITLEGHQGSVEPLAFSPDGRWLISGGADKTVRLWQVASLAGEKQSVTLDGHADAVTQLAVSADSLWLASASRDGVIFLWDLNAPDPAAAKQKLSLPGPIVALAFSPDARWLAAAGEDTQVMMWEVGPSVSAQPLVLGEHTGLVTALSFSPDGCWLASGGKDQKVRLWYMDPEKDRLGSVFYTLTGHTGEVDALAFPAVNAGGSSTWLASGGADHTVRLWDLSPLAVQGCGRVPGTDLPDSRTTDLPVTLLRGLDGKVNRLLFLAANQWLAGAGADGSARVWDTAFIAASDEPAWYDTSTTGRLFADALSPSGGWVFAAADEGVFAWPVDQPRAKPLALGCELKGAFSVTAGASGLMAAGCMDGPVLLWDQRALDSAGKVMPTQLSGLTSMVASLALRGDGQWLAAGDLKGRLLAWRLVDGVPQGSPLQLMNDAKTVRALVFAPDGRWLASADSLGRVRLWDFSGKTPAQLADFKPSENPVNALAVSPDGAWLAAGGQDSKVHLWKMSAFTPGQEPPVFHLDGFYGWVQSLAFSPNGLWLVAGSVDASLRQWDLAKLAALDPAQAPTPAADSVSVVLRDHDGQVFTVRYSPDSRWLISAGSDGTLRQWDPAQPDQVPVRFAGHSNNVRALAFTADGQSVISPGEDGTLRRWALSTEVIIRAACDETRRTFRPEEIHRYLDDIAPLEVCK